MGMAEMRRTNANAASTSAQLTWALADADGAHGHQQHEPQRAGGRSARSRVRASQRRRMSSTERSRKLDRALGPLRPVAEVAVEAGGRWR